MPSTLVCLAVLGGWVKPRLGEVTEGSYFPSVRAGRAGGNGRLGDSSLTRPSGRPIPGSSAALPGGGNSGVEDCL
jgi:hypothetical protein